MPFHVQFDHNLLLSTEKPAKPLPETGDGTNVDLWLALMVISGIGMAATVAIDRHFRKEKQHKQ